MADSEISERRRAPLQTPSNLASDATRDISAALNALLADTVALYFKTKNFHWHMSGPSFRDYHLLLDEQADQIFGSIDPIAERVRKLGGATLRSTGHASRLQRLSDNDAEFVTPIGMLAELREDNQRIAGFLRATHALCEYGDVATASFLENWIDEAERRTLFPVRIRSAELIAKHHSRGLTCSARRRWPSSPGPKAPGSPSRKTRTVAPGRPRRGPRRRGCRDRSGARCPSRVAQLPGAGMEFPLR